ncbi:MAG: diguanylate cyclase domain-containing protein [Nitrospiria bacterium]
MSDIYFRVLVTTLLLIVLWLKIKTTQENKRLELQQISATLLESVNDAIIIVDGNRKILSVNPAFTKITGYPAEEAVGKNTSILQSGKQGKAFYKAMWQAINEAGHWEGEIWNRRKNGEIYPGWLSIKAVKRETENSILYTGVFSDDTKHKQNEAKIQSLAHYDQFTGLANRVLFKERLSQALKQSRRKLSQLAVLFLDLDRFKFINDTHGHLVGDEVLKKTAGRLLSSVRETDTVARSGGDEFLIVLSNTTGRSEVAIIAKKIIRALSSPFKVGGQEITIGISIGIAIAPCDGRRTMLLMKNADHALYKAKNAGRNTFIFFSKESDHRGVA